MRQLLTVLLGIALLVGVGLPAAYFLFERDLPPLGDYDQVSHTLKIFVEGQQQRALAGIDPRRVEAFEVLSRDQLSEGLIAGALTIEGCPDFFTGQREEGLAWLWRDVGFALGMGKGAPGPGQCDLKYADRLADALGLPSGVHRAIAIYEFHYALTKEQLLMAELSSRYFGTGVLGVRSASKHLFGKEPRQLTLAESAELLLAEGNYTSILNCKAPDNLKTMRNNILNSMSAMNLVKKELVEKAKKEPLFCITRPG
jgi:hypothetical protein